MVHAGVSSFFGLVPAPDDDPMGVDAYETALTALLTNASLLSRALELYPPVSEVGSFENEEVDRGDRRIN